MFLCSLIENLASNWAGNWEYAHIILSSLILVISKSIFPYSSRQLYNSFADFGSWHADKAYEDGEV